MSDNGKGKNSVGLRVCSREIPENLTKEDVYNWFQNVRDKHKFVPNDEAMWLIKESLDNPEFDGFRFVDTLVTYQNVLDGSVGYTLTDYINAIRYCSYLESNGGNSAQAYAKTFGHREFVQRCTAEGRSLQDKSNLTSASTRYRKSPLVVKILTQSEVPLYLMFQGYRYKAINVLVDRMENAKYDKDRINAADRLLTHLKPPENVKIELDVGVKKDEIVSKYESLLENMVKRQKELLASGEQLDKVANSKNEYIDTEVVDG